MTPPEAPVGRLVVCPTPIGNLQDITLRALSVLRDADVIACEDTRRTGLLLERHAVPGRMVSMHEHNERARSIELAERIDAGALVALVSDAGTPVISDPGFALVRECLARGLPVEVLPGPSAVTTALVASGLASERWRFVGFLPRSRSELERLLVQTPETLVAFESPRRLAATLELLAAADPDRALAVCRELTKIHEEVRRGSAAELAAHYRLHEPRGEIVLVCAAAEPGRASSEAAVQALRALVAAGARARPAAAAVGGLTGIGANALYRELTSGGQ
ncbi:MAG TPA: 16S rRNA (cytidine(1402)-2'-O)-methyltransferase [Solirubrobacteraceae bacterium]|jgi:16S rRNA (cytidine1402-2'-O)-methyltransferase